VEAMKALHEHVYQVVTKDIHSFCFPQHSSKDQTAVCIKLKNSNKCIGDDTKAATHQSLNCIKNKNKIKYGKKRFSIWQIEFLHPAMWHNHDTDFAR